MGTFAARKRDAFAKSGGDVFGRSDSVRLQDIQQQKNVSGWLKKEGDSLICHAIVNRNSRIVT